MFNLSERRSSHGRRNRVIASVVAVGLLGGGFHLAQQTAWAASAKCPVYGESVTQQAIGDPVVKELSGLAASHRNKDILWTHNDSGDTARVFALSSAGKIVGIYNLDGVKAKDFEDIDVGPGYTSASGVYVFDTGKSGDRDGAQVYRFDEPSVSASQSQTTATVKAQKFDIKYRKPGTVDQFAMINVEATFVDPKDGSLYFIHKTLDTKNTTVYKVAGSELKDGASVVAEPVVTIVGKTNGVSHGPTGADFSADRSMIVVRNYIETMIWPVGKNADVVATFKANPAAPCSAKIPSSGEAVAFLADHSLASVKEGKNAGLSITPIKAANSTTTTAKPTTTTTVVSSTSSTVVSSTSSTSSTTSSTVVSTTSSTSSTVAPTTSSTIEPGTTSSTVISSTTTTAKPTTTTAKPTTTTVKSGTSVTTEITVDPELIKEVFKLLGQLLGSLNVTISTKPLQ